MTDIFSVKFKLPLKRRTVNDIIKNQHSIIKKSSIFDKNFKSTRSPIYKKLDCLLERWLDLMTSKGAIINDALLQNKASTFSKKLGLTNFKGSRGFIDKFKKRHGYKLRKLYGNKKTSKKLNFKHFFENFSTVRKNYKDSDIFNMDETGKKIIN